MQCMFRAFCIDAVIIKLLAKKYSKILQIITIF